MADKATEISRLLTPTVEALGLELLGVEYLPAAGNAVLRLYIDVPGGEGEARMVSIEDCESVSREVSALLDVEDPISSHYTLEVSSPGIDRPLFNAGQFGRFIGEQVKITLKLPQAGRRRMQGRIIRLDGQTVHIGVEAVGGDVQEVQVAAENIEKARLVPDWVALGFAPKEPKARGGKAAKSPKK